MAKYDAYQYANEKTYNNQLPVDGEVIAPFVVTWDQVQHDHMDRNNLKTWTLRGGRKVLVAFMVCKLEEFDSMMRLYNYMADSDNDYHPEDAYSIDKMEEDANDPDKKGKLPDAATVPSAAEVIMASHQVEDLIAEVAAADPKSGAILSLIAEQVRETNKLNRGEIVQKLGLGKSQGYEDIKTAQRKAREVREKTW